jgi:cytochrome c553
MANQSEGEPMRVVLLLTLSLLLLAGAVIGQEASQPVGSMSELMVSMIYPAANDILLLINRGGPKDDKEWVALQYSAIRLAESGNVLMMRGRALNQDDWMKDAKMLVDVGASVYKAARAKDAGALAALNDSINAACTTCHKQYRPNVHPRP